MRRKVAAVALAVGLALGLAGAARGGDEAEANRLLVEAIDFVEQARSSREAANQATLYESALERLATIVERYPDSDGARRLAEGVPFERLEIERLWRLSSAERCIDAWDRLCLAAIALEMSSHIVSDYDRSSLKALIAQGQAKAGAIPLALETANSIGRWARKVWALGAVAAEAGSGSEGPTSSDILRQAAEIARLSTGPQEQSLMMATVAAWSAEAGDHLYGNWGLEHASILLRQFGAWEPRVRTLLAMAQAQAKLGDVKASEQSIAEVRGYLDKYGTNYHRINFLSDIAWVQAEIGANEAALETIAEALDLTSGLDSYLERIARAAANTGDIKLTRDISDAIDQPYHRAMALTSLALAYASQGDIAGARRSLHGALQVGGEVKEMENRSFIFASMLCAMESKIN